MLRRGTIWLTASVAALGVASIGAAATGSIAQPASVADLADRLGPSTAPDLDPTRRAIVEVVEHVNAERSRRGLPPLLLDAQVSTAAQAHAAGMAATRTMSHLGVDGADGGVRLTRAGYAWASWAENIAAGIHDPAGLVATWMQSDGHRTNLLGDFVDVGVGVVATTDGVPYWSLLLARHSD